MIIQLNTDKSFVMHEDFGNDLKDMLSKELSHFTDHITRLEVHLSDENGSKEGANDKRCVLEARIAGKQPTVVTADANTHEQSVKAAADKMKHALESIVGKMKSHHA